MYTLVLNEKGECEVAWCTANETFYLDNKTTSPYAVHIGLNYLSFKDKKRHYGPHKRK